MNSLNPEIKAEIQTHLQIPDAMAEIVVFKRHTQLWTKNNNKLIRCL